MYRWMCEAASRFLSVRTRVPDRGLVVRDERLAGLDGAAAVPDRGLEVFDGWAAVCDGSAAVVDREVADLDGGAAVLDWGFDVLDGELTVLDGSAAVVERGVAALDGSVAVLDGEFAGRDGSAAVVDREIADLDAGAVVVDWGFDVLDGELAVLDGSAAVLDRGLEVFGGWAAVCEGWLAGAGTAAVLGFFGAAGVLVFLVLAAPEGKEGDDYGDMCGVQGGDAERDGSALRRTVRGVRRRGGWRGARYVAGVLFLAAVGGVLAGLARLIAP